MRPGSSHRSWMPATTKRRTKIYSPAVNTWLTGTSTVSVGTDEFRQADVGDAGDCEGGPDNWFNQLPDPETALWLFGGLVFHFFLEGLPDCLLADKAFFIRLHLPGGDIFGFTFWNNRSFFAGFAHCNSHSSIVLVGCQVTNDLTGK